jgi:hypothetical protein
MADTNPARALDVVKRIVEMCNFIEDPAIQEAVKTKMVPVSMPSDVNSVLKISVWVGLGTVGLWAALDAFAERRGLKNKKCPICKRKLCIWARYTHNLNIGPISKGIEELEDLRHLYAHNYAGEADDVYFKFCRHVLRRGVPRSLSCGAQFDGRQLALNLHDLRWYVQTVESVLKRF